MSHKYQLRDLVRLANPFPRDERSKEVYEVTRVMPADQSGELSYRIKSSGAGERAVRESEITGAKPAANQLGSSAFKEPAVQTRN